MSDRPKMVYDHVTRDLCDLVRKRQDEVVLSVVQLGENAAQKYAILQAAASNALGMAAGGYAAWQDLDIDDIAMARGVLDLIEITRREKAAASEVSHGA